MRDKVIKNLEASIRAKLLNYAKATGENYNAVLNRFFQERFLARLSETKYKQLTHSDLYRIRRCGSGRIRRKITTCDSKRFRDPKNIDLSVGIGNSRKISGNCLSRRNQ